jgi:hypothetical protein
MFGEGGRGQSLAAVVGRNSTSARQRRAFLEHFIDGNWIGLGTDHSTALSRGQ